MNTQWLNKFIFSQSAVFCWPIHPPWPLCCSTHQMTSFFAPVIITREGFKCQVYRFLHDRLYAMVQRIYQAKMESTSLWICEFQADQNLLVSHLILLNYPLKSAVVRKRLTSLRMLDFALHCIMPVPTVASRVCVRTWILWQVQMLQYTSRTLIIEMKNLTGDFIKELARWQITEASEGQKVSSYTQSKTEAL